VGHEDELKRLASELEIPWGDYKSMGLREERSEDVGQRIGGRGRKSVGIGQSSIVFMGPQFGEEKAACYRDCDAFILPSFSEGLPMVVLEAWAYAKPVLMTPECNLPEGYAAGAALRIETNPQTLAASLDDLFRTPHSALRALGEKGRELVVTRFTWPRIAAEMKAVYDWVLGGGPKPACVITN
jgi:poly(glycerol-phosphate) alpha-glucosyltransferase